MSDSQLLEEMSSGVGRDRLLHQYRMTTQSLRQDMDALKQWAAKQPHLPDIACLNESTDTWLEGMLLLTKGSVERAKRAIDSYITARTACPQLFRGRDPRHPDMRDSFSQVKIALLPGLTPDGHRVLLMQIASTASSGYRLEQHMRRCTMLVDWHLLHGVDFAGLHVVHDLQHVSGAHLSQFSLQLMRAMAAGMKAYPCRVPKITLINTPYFVDKLLGLFRPFMSTKLMSRVSSHKDCSALLRELPAKVVPRDYGGLAPSLDNLNEFWLRQMEESAHFFALCDSLKTIESLRLGIKNVSSLDECHNGSFRQLSLD